MKLQLGMRELGLVVARLPHHLTQLQRFFLPSSRCRSKTTINDLNFSLSPNGIGAWQASCPAKPAEPKPLAARQGLASLGAVLSAPITSTAVGPLDQAAGR